MNKHNLNNLLFVLLVLILAIIAKVDRDNLKDNSFQENIQGTSLVISSQQNLTSPSGAKYRQAQNLAVIEQALFDDVSNVPSKNWGVALPDPKTQVAFVEDLNSGVELFALNSNSRWAIASLTKLMTAVIAVENIGKEKRVPITETALASEGIAGNFQVGEVYSAHDLVKAMLITSSNDAAAALAEFYGESNFMEAMQKKAADLGMAQTVFADATGLSYLNQSTVYDLEKLVKYTLNSHPELFDITRQTEVKLFEINSRRQKTLANINFLAGRKDFLGGKTGFIDASGSNLISIFSHKGRQILIIIFGTEDRFGQTELLYNWVKNSYEF